MSFGVLIFALAIIVVILVHESAHFATARWFKIKVEEFFVGFGPRLWSTRRGETEYGVKALPFGGYVRIAGMNPYEEISPEEYPRTFGAKPIWQRATVIAAGPMTHFVIAFLFFFVWFGAIGLPSKYEPVVSVVDAKLGGQVSPAAAAGLRPGDVIVGVDGIAHPGDGQLVDYTRKRVGQPVTLRVLRDGRTFTVTVTPVLATVGNQQVGRIGVVLSPGRVLARDRTGFFGSFAKAGTFVWKSVLLVLASLGRIFGPQGIGRLFSLVFGHAQRTPNDVTSVIGAARAAGQAVQQGYVDLLFYELAVLNVFIGILNLVPLPPFDGGHLAVLAVEKVRGRKVDMRRLAPLTAAVAAFLVMFVLLVSYLDIVKPIPNLFR